MKRIAIMYWDDLNRKHYTVIMMNELEIFKNRYDRVELVD